MTKGPFLLHLLACCQLVFAQKAVNNLHYDLKKELTSPKRSFVEEISNVNFNWNKDAKLLVADKVKNGGQTPRIILDGNRNIVLVKLFNRPEYIMEEIDSFFNGKDTFELTGETKEIQGLKCTRYIKKKDLTLNNAVGKPTYHTEYSLWTTQDLIFEESLNPYLYALLYGTGQMGTGPYSSHVICVNFKGVLVELDITTTIKDFTTTTIFKLDTEQLNQESEKITWPWIEENGTALIEGQVTGNRTLAGTGYENAGDAHYRKGDGSLKNQNDRLKALIQEVTGQEKPLTKKAVYENLGFDTHPYY